MNYLFAEGGINFNYHSSLGYKWGLGGVVGIGAEYTFQQGLSVFVTPQIQYNLLILERSPYIMTLGIDKLIQIGCNIGVGYKF
ncbi:MAG: hypothetical protein LBH77_10940 [Tannerella sp.]|jgi:hypothetical protein|nr:hypothetical protein [Tannerella sp.]